MTDSTDVILEFKDTKLNPKQSEDFREYLYKNKIHPISLTAVVKETVYDMQNDVWVILSDNTVVPDSYSNTLHVQPLDSNKHYQFSYMKDQLSYFYDMSHKTKIIKLKKDWLKSLEPNQNGGGKYSSTGEKVTFLKGGKKVVRVVYVNKRHTRFVKLDGGMTRLSSLKLA